MTIEKAPAMDPLRPETGRIGLNRRTFLTHSALAASAPLAMASSAVAQSSPRPEPRGHMQGWTYLQGRQRAPHAWFIDGDKRSMTTDRFLGSPVLMVFWQQDCAYCRTDMPRLNVAYDGLVDKGIKVVPMTVGPEKLTDQIRQHYAQMKYNKLPIYADAAAEMQQGYGLRGTPTWFLIDKQGFVVGYIERPVNWAEPDAVNFLSAFV